MTIAEELRRSHAALVEMMDEIDRIVGERDFGIGRLGLARLRLSQARRHSRMLVDQAVASLGPEQRRSAAAVLAEIRAAGNDALHATARHSGQWHARAVSEDLAGYRTATRLLRQIWLRTIAAEQRLLLPMIDPLATAA